VRESDKQCSCCSAGVASKLQGSDIGGCLRHPKHDSNVYTSIHTVLLDTRINDVAGPRLNHKDDTYDNMDSASHSALQGCVASLQNSMQLLDSSINILDSGVSDYPRLRKVLQTTRVILPLLSPTTTQIIHKLTHRDSTSN
jgi:hypothetical protein